MPCWTLRKAFRFEAAHRLPHHDGKCQRLHGHSWRGWMIVAGETLQMDGPQRDMLIDYGRLADVLAPLLEDYLDHHDLNATTALPNPTSETLAQWIYDRLCPQIAGLIAIEIEETCTASARYEPERSP